MFSLASNSPDPQQRDGWSITPEDTVVEARSDLLNIYVQETPRVCCWIAPAPYTFMASRRWTVKAVAIKRWYGVLTARGVLLEKVKTRL